MPRLFPKRVKLLPRCLRLRKLSSCCLAPSNCRKPGKKSKPDSQKPKNKSKPDSQPHQQHQHQQAREEQPQKEQERPNTQPPAKEKPVKSDRQADEHNTGVTRVRNAIVAKKPSVVTLTGLSNGSQDGQGVGIGILFRRNLVLTSHATIPTAESAKEGEMALSYPGTGCCSAQTTVKLKLLPNKTFVTNPALDVTVVACEDVSSAVPLTIELSKGPRGSLGIDNKVYVLGSPEGSKPTPKSLKVGEARVAMESDSVVKFDTGSGELWLSGSAGFNSRGEFAFMICQPRRLATKSASYECKAACSKRTKQSGVTRIEILQWIEGHLGGDTAASQSPSPENSESPRQDDELVESITSSQGCRHHHHHPRNHHHHRHHHLNLRTESPESELDMVVPCSYIESPRSCSSGLNPRQPGVSYPATPSTKSSARTSPFRRPMSPNPRLPGISYSTSPSRSMTSAKSRRSTPSTANRGSRGSSPCYRLPSPSPCLSAKRRSPRERSPCRARPSISSCCLGASSSTGYDETEAGHQRHLDDEKFQEFLNSPEFEPPPYPQSGSSSEEEVITPGAAYSSSIPRGRSTTRFKGPCRSSRLGRDEHAGSDGEVYLGVGYMKHTQVSRRRTSQKFGLPAYTVWHH